MSEFGFHGAPVQFTIISGIIVVAVIGIFGYIIVQLIMTRKKNDSSPRETVEAAVVGKRVDVSGFDHTHTTYYATFQLWNADRLELKIKGDEYGMIAEGDRGILSYQGTRFLSFERKKDNP